MFELMKNDDPWDDDVKSKLHFDVLNKKEFDGDYSTGEFFYSIAQIHNWFQTVQDSGKKFYIHSVEVFSEPGEGDDSCDFKASYIHIRWFEEGTILDAYRDAWLANTRRDIGIGIGLAAAGVAGLAVLGLIGKRIYSNLVTSRIATIRAADGYVDIDVLDPDDLAKTKTKTISVTKEQFEQLKKDSPESEKLIRRLFSRSTEGATSVTLDGNALNLQVEGAKIKDRLSSIYYGLPKTNYLSEAEMADLKTKFNGLQLTEGKASIEFKKRK